MEAADRLRRRARPLPRAWARHPRLGLAGKAAVAAALAWAVARAVPGPAGQYPYYAPLGALLATTTTLAGSARESAQTVAAIVAGAGIALAVDAVAPAELVGIAVVVAAGVLLAGWERLGSARSWVPTAALFVLIIGGRDPVGYVLGYAGLTALGAVVGLAVTAAFPPAAAHRRAGAAGPAAGHPGRAAGRPRRRPAARAPAHRGRVAAPDA